MRNLVVVFSSIRPKHYGDEVNNQREIEYYICLQHLEKMVPKNYDILYCENTISGLEDLNLPQLFKFLSNRNFLSVKENLGTKNKGMGELDMLYAASKHLDFSEYDKVSYCTGRKLFTCPYVFERSNALEKDALISNPDFLYINGQFHITEKNGMYNDMFFTMKSKIMQKYAEYSKEKIEFNVTNMIGSEQNLYNFVAENKLEFEWLEWLGIVRNDIGITNEIFNIKNFHVC